MSRKRDIEAMANLLGNSAAHAALLPDSEYARKEVTLYLTDVYDMASARSFSNAEIEQIRQRAVKRAVSEVKKRIMKYGFDWKRLEEFMKAAEKYIEGILAELF